MREQFLLDPAVTFLNHGSFGACPRPVFAAYQQWQQQVEAQPVAFFQREIEQRLGAVREVVAGYLKGEAENLHFVRNATVGINIIARSIRLAAGDEVLTTDHEYGAMDGTWQFVCEGAGARYVQQAISLPYTTDEAFIEQLWAGVTERTRVIFLSHITSPTAVRFPVAAVCARARAEGILTVIDGAHAPGQIPVDLTAIGADYYTGNFHKWLCAPKSAGFMYARTEHQANWYPLVVSWGWIRGETPIERLQWRGTEDVSAFLAVPDAIRFQAEQDWDQVRAACHDLALEARAELNALVGGVALTPDNNIGQMFAVMLPACDAAAVQRALLERYRVEVPIIQWQGRQLVRVSVQGYNTRGDIDVLVRGIEEVLEG